MPDPLQFTISQLSDRPLSYDFKSSDLFIATIGTDTGLLSTVHISAHEIYDYVNDTLRANSGSWVSDYNTMNSNSAFWRSCYNTVSSNSSCWEKGCSVFDSISPLTAGWSAATSGVQSGLTAMVADYSANSAMWIASQIYIDKLYEGTSNDIFTQSAFILKNGKVALGPVGDVHYGRGIFQTGDLFVNYTKYLSSDNPMHTIVGHNSTNRVYFDIGSPTLKQDFITEYNDSAIVYYSPGNANYPQIYPQLAVCQTTVGRTVSAERIYAFGNCVFMIDQLSALYVKPTQYNFDHGYNLAHAGIGLSNTASFNGRPQTYFRQVTGQNSFSTAKVIKLYGSSDVTFAKCSSFAGPNVWYVWGDNTKGQLGTGNDTTYMEPVSVGWTMDDVYIPASTKSLPVYGLSGNDLYVWGSSDNGIFYLDIIPGTTARYSPRKVTSIGNISKVYIGNTLNEYFNKNLDDYYINSLGNNKDAFALFLGTTGTLSSLGDNGNLYLGKGAATTGSALYEVAHSGVSDFWCAGGGGTYDSAGERASTTKYLQTSEIVINQKTNVVDSFSTNNLSVATIVMDTTKSTTEIIATYGTKTSNWAQVNITATKYGLGNASVGDYVDVYYSVDDINNERLLATFTNTDNIDTVTLTTGLGQYVMSIRLKYRSGTVSSGSGIKVTVNVTPGAGLTYYSDVNAFPQICVLQNTDLRTNYNSNSIPNASLLPFTPDIVMGVRNNRLGVGISGGYSYFSTIFYQGRRTYANSSLPYLVGELDANSQPDNIYNTKAVNINNTSITPILGNYLYDIIAFKQGIAQPFKQLNTFLPFVSTTNPSSPVNEFNGYFACFLKGTGVAPISAFGYNLQYGLGISPNTTVVRPVSCDSGTTSNIVTKIVPMFTVGKGVSAGDIYGCTFMLTTAGNVYATGKNTVGDCGIPWLYGTNITSFTQIPLDGKTIKDIQPVCFNYNMTNNTRVGHLWCLATDGTLFMI